MTVTEILTGHVSPESAFVVDDYPYGFRLRCKIRYWLECHPKRGVRFFSQTTNPKLPGEVWNKPKVSTYCRFGGAMYLDANRHVQWTGVGEYTDGAEAEAWRAVFGAGLPEAYHAPLDKWIRLRRKAEELLRTGQIKIEVTSVRRVV
jgi:hypothetical protein